MTLFRGAIRRRVAAAVAVAVAATGLAFAVAAPASAAPRVDVDTDKPVYVGYDTKRKRYHFKITGRWAVTCAGSTKYCYPKGGGTASQIGSDDALWINTGAAMTWDYGRVRTYDSCGTLTSDSGVKRNTVAANDYFYTAFGLDDRLTPSYYVTKNSAGRVISEGGSCRTGFMPSRTYTSTTGSTTFWYNLKTRSYTIDVWGNPANTGCLKAGKAINAGYLHTWSTWGVEWGLEAGLDASKFEVGIGVSASLSSLDHAWATGYREDAFADAKAYMPRMCHH